MTPFDSEAEAVHAANDSPYGLNAMVVTADLSRAHRVAAPRGPARSGPTASSSAPFGGFADSGWGREGGTVSREFLTEPKAVVMAIRH